MYLDQPGLMALWSRAKAVFAGKSHTHDISTLSGTAKSAEKLSTARTINLSGAVSGSATFDGSGNVSITTAANESYVSSPISGLFNMAVDADGNLWVYHSDSDKAPNFEYDSATGNLYYVTEA
nr:MAG TPA: Dec protein, OB-Fold, Decoration, VIRAL PROTEIN [Caudoviricetes sp.]